MTQLKKPMVVHNGMMDLMFLYNAFIGMLPEDVAVYKREINRLFPHIHDTRHLLNTRMSLRKDVPSGLSLQGIFDHLMKPDFNFN